MSDRSSKREKGDRLWYRIVRSVMPAMATAYFKLVDLTSRKVFLNQEHEEEVWKKGPFSVAAFHQTCLFSAYYIGKYGAVVMVSRSWDGGLIADTVKRWGWRTTRGSSSSGGKEALAEMIEVAKANNCPSGLAVDAPRGPAGKVKMGIVMIGRDTGHPVAPFAMWTTRHLQFNSWDKTIVPLPFNTIVMAFGKPVTVPTGLAREDYERLRQEIEDNLASVHALAQDKVNELKNARCVS